MRKISAELQPVLNQLQSEGFDVYTYSTTGDDEREKEINSLFWYENGRMLNIHPNSWRNEKYARDIFDIGVSYIPSRENGSGCGLTDDKGASAERLLSFRNYLTWVRGVENYKNIEHFLKNETVLRFWKIEPTV